MTALASCRRMLTHGILALWLALTGTAAFGRVLDDFSAGKIGWEDFSFNPALPAPAVDGGQFKFVLPPVGQAIFIASTKKSETFELKEGRTIEFRVDLVQGGGKDSFAVLAFIPTSTGAQTLAGYGMAKSTTDVLITKGIGKYFYNENPPALVKNENVTLSLTLTAQGGNVVVTARVLDKEANDAVLFEKTVIDTPAADVLADGTDSPAAPYLTQGHFVLYLYEDFDAGAPEDPYQVTFDNAEVFVTDAALVDDFNSGKTGWEDFSFNPALPAPTVDGGQFKFVLPPVGQAIFIASTKKSKTYELKEGERLELRADLVQGGGKDSFAVLAFIPTSTGAQTLAGYGMAKSTTDVLITKGIGKYFYNENPPTLVKNENVTLSLTLTARGGNVFVTARVLDKDANNAVIFEKTVVDTPAADVLSDGTDSPAAPFITQGNVVLYLYADFDQNAPEDPYQVTYDDLVVASPPGAANEPPVISQVQPAASANFLPTSTTISFSAADDQALGDDALSITLNGTVYTAANGLVLGGAGISRTASLAGKLEADVNYTAILKVVDTEGAIREQTLRFDTFAASNRIIEIEDYNFSAGQFIENPVPTPEGSGPDSTTYSNQEGVPSVDYSDTRTAPNGTDTKYRSVDPIRMARSLDQVRRKFSDAGGAEATVYDYDVGDLAAGEWLQYTRTFAAGTYEVYLREQVLNLPTGDSVLELVTGDRTQPDAATRQLGTFLGKGGGFAYQNVLLTDGSGQNPVVLRLNGLTTLRLRTLTADVDDAYRLLNYLLFVPVPDPGVQRATVASTSPAAHATVETASPTIEVILQNRDTTVNLSTVKLRLNGADVASTVVTATADGARVSAAITPLPPSGSSNTAVVTFKDSDGQDITTEWSFVITYKSANPAARLVGTGKTPGFKLRVVQAPLELSPLENSLDRAETQLASGSSIPRAVDTNTVVNLINFDKQAGSTRGFFPDDVMVPGIDPDFTGNGDQDFAVEILTYLELPAGVHRFGITSDDGYKLASGVGPLTSSTPSLAFHNGGPANDETFDLVVAEAGFYPFRMVWYERGGAGHAEWYTVNPASGDRTLVNDSAAAGAIKAWAEVQAEAPSIILESAAAVTGPFTPEAGAIVNAGAKTVTVPGSGDLRFYRLRAGSALTIKSIQVQTGSVVLTWQ